MIVISFIMNIILINDFRFLHDNNICGSIPKGFSKLSELKYL